MGWYLGVGVQRKAVDTGTLRANQYGTFPFIAKACANAADLLPGPFPEGEALRDRGRHGTGELRLGVAQRIISGSHPAIHARFQIPQPAERADDPPTELLEHRGNVGIGR
jgi:hypothetical protein